MFLLKKILSALILPPVGPLLVIAVGLFMTRRHPRVGRALAILGVVFGLAMITPLSVAPMLHPLEDYPPLSDVALQHADAIVILAGGLRNHAPEFGSGTVNARTLERIRYGARLARRSGLPVLVTGRGKEAEWMRQSLEEDFGVKVRWMEDQSRDTRENADFSARILQPAGHRRIVLVTHAAHMRRAEAWFGHAGFQVLPAPTAYFSNPHGTDESDDTNRLGRVLPSMSTAYAGWFALHEWLGLLAYRLSP